MEDYIEVIPEIIKAASGSILGILALIIVVMSILAYGFFRNEGPKVKLFVFLILFSGSALFVQQMYDAEPVMAANEFEEDDSTPSENIANSKEPEPPSIPSSKTETKSPKSINKPPQIAKKASQQKMVNMVGKTISKSSSKTTSAVKATSKKIIGQTQNKATPSPPVVIASAKPAPPICIPVWTPWHKPGKKIKNICAPGCAPSKKMSKSFRIVGFPPKPQVKYKYKCSIISR